MTRPTTPTAPTLLRGAAVVLLVLTVLVGALAGQRLRDRPDPAPRAADAPRSEAEAAARDFFTLDHRSLDADVARVLETATGDFEAQYRKQSAKLQDEVRAKKLVLTASVPESGSALEYLADREAWFLVSVNVHTEGAEGLSQDGRYRTRVVLQRRGGSWLVARLEQVG